MIVIDTCVLSSLAKIDRFDLLRESFENIIVTPSVVNETEKVGEAKFVKRIKEALYFDEIKEVCLTKFPPPRQSSATHSTRLPDWATHGNVIL